MKKLLLLLLACISIYSAGDSFAHPGRTASDGMHYCRTNCASWGETYGVRHGHGYTPSYSYTAPKKRCPANSYLSGNSCHCNYGYASSLSGKSCIKIPKNAHEVNSTTDVWMCDSGYKEQGNYCVKIVTNCGNNSVSSGEKTCICKAGYQWENYDDNKNLNCIKSIKKKSLSWFNW